MNKQFVLFVISMHLTCGWVFAEPFFADGFESGDLSHVDVESGATWNGGSCHDTESDGECISTEITHTGQYALKFFMKGNPDLNDDAWVEQRFDLGSQMDEVYIRFYIYYPSNYVIREVPGGTENTKMMYLWGDSYQNDMNKIGVEYEIDLHYGVKAKISGGSPTCSGSTGTVRDFSKAQTSIADFKGRWTAVEFYTRRDTGIGDGVFQLWIDGDLEIDGQNMTWTGAPCGLNEYFKNGYLMGWSNSGFTEDTAVFIDDVVFSTSYIGLIDALVPSAPSSPQDFTRDD